MIQINCGAKEFPIMSLLFDNTVVLILKYNYIKFYICKTNRNFKTRYKECISVIKLKKAFNFA